jgi:hypothetical protein
MSVCPWVFGIGRSGLVGLICLAGACVSYGADAPKQPIEIVLVPKPAVNTNINEEEPAKTRNSDKVPPGAVHSPNLEDSLHGAHPLVAFPTEAQPLTQSEQEWIGGGRNRVFMTPEELTSDTEVEKLLGTKGSDKDGVSKGATTALERDYMQLWDADHQGVKNQLNNEVDSEPSYGAKNWFKTAKAGDHADHSFEGTTHRSENPFSTRTDEGISKPERPESSSDAFNLNAGAGAQSDEEVREEKEQEAHIEAFKQIWNIDQPATLSEPASGESGSVAASVSGAQPIVGAASPAVSQSSPQESSSASQSAQNSQRTSPMRQPNFTAPRFRF